MKLTRIVNRGRVAPTSPKPTIDSGRTSWSSASVVSTIDTKSPEPKLLEEEINQKLQQSISTSSLTKKILITICITAVVLLIVGIILGIALPLTLNKPTPSISSTTASVDINLSTTKVK